MCKCIEDGRNKYNANMNHNHTFCMSANISSVGIREAHVVTNNSALTMALQRGWVVILHVCE